MREKKDLRPTSLIITKKTILNRLVKTLVIVMIIDNKSVSFMRLYSCVNNVMVVKIVVLQIKMMRMVEVKMVILAVRMMAVRMVVG